ncbi:MAG: BatD family protein [Deltaproteobacteria bacterium]|nr:BatD family protein [Deltaproteobacteria bacterium]
MITEFRKYWLLIMLAAFIRPIFAAADIEVNINVEPQTITVGENINVEVTVSGSDVDSIAGPKYESDSNFSVTGKGRRSEISIVNGKASSRISYTFTLSPSLDLKPGRYPLPRGTLELTNGRVEILKEQQVTITQNFPTQAKDTSGNLDFAQIVDNLSPYVGEQIRYHAELTTAIPLQGINFSEVNYLDLLRESLGEAKQQVKSLGNRTLATVWLDEALFPNKQGEITIPARKVTVQVKVRNSNASQRSRFAYDVFPDLLNIDAFRIENRNIIAPTINLNVKPLPPAPLEQAYYPVGNVSLNATIDKNNVKEGESITLKFTFSGDANLRPLELPDINSLVSKDFRVYLDQPEFSSEINSGRIFQKKTFSVALVPLKPGTFSFPEIRVAVFDPQAQKYSILKNTAHAINVKPDPNIKNTLEKEEQAISAPLGIEKTDVKILNVDLLPQHLGAETFAPMSSPDSLLLPIVVVLAPIVSLLLIYYRGKLHLYKNRPELVKQLLAYDNAIKALGEPAIGDGIQKFDTILRQYIGDKFIVNGHSLTPDQARQLIKDQLSHDQLADKVRDILKAGENTKYAAGSYIQQLNSASFRTEVSDIINALNKAMRR